MTVFKKACYGPGHILPLLGLMLCAACSSLAPRHAQSAQSANDPIAPYRIVTGKELSRLITGSVIIALPEDNDQIRLTSPPPREYFMEFGKYVLRGHQTGYDTGTYTLTGDSICVHRAGARESCTKIYSDGVGYYRSPVTNIHRQPISIARIMPGEI